MRESMSPRERVLAAIERRSMDRVPADFAAKDSVLERLKQHLGLSTNESVLEALHIDMRRVLGTDLWSTAVAVEDDCHVNVFGYAWPVGTSPYAHSGTTRSFSDEATLDDILTGPWRLPEDFDHPTVGDQCRAHAARYATYGSPWCPFFHELGWLLGQETLFQWLLTRPSLVEELVKNVVEIHLESCRRFFEAANGMLDVAYFGNDYGTQHGLVLSPSLWQTFFRGPQKRFFDLAHDYGCRVMFHSCGSIRDLLPWLIEDGVDILDPVQTTAKGMNLEGLVDRFGDSLTFHGGVDMQRTLPFGSVEDVRAEVRRNLGTTRGRAGYILTSSQKLLDDVPTDNILTMYDINLRG